MKLPFIQYVMLESLMVTSLGQKSQILCYIAVTDIELAQYNLNKGLLEILELYPCLVLRQIFLSHACFVYIMVVCPDVEE